MGVEARYQRGLKGSMTQNQELRESMTFWGTAKTWSSLCSEGEVESGKRWHQANYPRSLGFILESVRASIIGFSFQRRKWSGPLTELSWISSDTTANNKKDASSLRTPDSIHTWSPAGTSKGSALAIFSWPLKQSLGDLILLTPS